MRRVMLLALLALALPTAALANSFNIDGFMCGQFTPQGAPFCQFGTGGTGMGTMTDLSNPFRVEVTGTVAPATGTIILTTRTLIPLTSGNLLFARGFLTAKNSAGSTIFTSSLIDGSVIPNPDCCPPFGEEVSITASIPPNPQLMITSGFVNIDVIVRKDHTLSGGVAGITLFGPVPEPSALEGLSFGTGMLGLAEMTRRKLRLGT